MDLKQLRYFVSVTELGSFSAAAGRLNIAQSALSRQIANLETDLGAVLVSRSGRGVHLTRAGERLYEAATKLLLDAEGLRSVVAEAAGEIAGCVGLGAHFSDGDILLPRLFDRVRKECPRVRIDPIQGLTAELQEALLKGRLDLAIVTFPDALPTIDLQPLAREKVYVVAPSDSHPVKSDSCTVREALSLPLILHHEPQRERSGIDALAKKHGIMLNVVVEADGHPLMKALARQGHGTLLLPEAAVQQERLDPAWRLVLITDIMMTRYLAQRAGPIVSNAVAQIHAMLFEEIDQLKSLGIMH